MSEKWEIVGKAKKSKTSVATKDSSDNKKGSAGVAKKPTYEEIRKQIHSEKACQRYRLTLSIVMQLQFRSML